MNEKHNHRYCIRGSSGNFVDAPHNLAACRNAGLNLLRYSGNRTILATARQFTRSPWPLFRGFGYPY